MRGRGRGARARVVAVRCRHSRRAAPRAGRIALRGRGRRRHRRAGDAARPHGHARAARPRARRGRRRRGRGAPRPVRPGARPARAGSRSARDEPRALACPVPGRGRWRHGPDRPRGGLDRAAGLGARPRGRGGGAASRPRALRRPRPVRSRHSGRRLRMDLSQGGPSLGGRRRLHARRCAAPAPGRARPLPPRRRARRGERAPGARGAHPCATPPGRRPRSGAPHRRRRRSRGSAHGRGDLARDPERPPGGRIAARGAGSTPGARPASTLRRSTGASFAISASRAAWRGCSTAGRLSRAASCRVSASWPERR